MIQILLNGKEIQTAASSIKEFLTEQKMEGKPVIVELNREALTASAHQSTSLKEGDVIELFVLGAGG